MTQKVDNRFTRVLGQVANDVAELFPYLFAFYLLSLATSFLFPAWHRFFYWPGFHGSMLVLACVSCASGRGRWLFRRVANLFSENIEQIQGHGDFVRSSAVRSSISFIRLCQDCAYRGQAVVFVGAYRAYAVILAGVRVADRMILRPLIAFVLRIHVRLTRADYARIAIIGAILIYALVQGIDIVSFIALTYGLASMLFLLDSRLPAGVALALLVIVPVLLLFGLEAYAEKLAVYAYYCLVITVGTELADSCARRRVEKDEEVTEKSV